MRCEGVSFIVASSILGNTEKLNNSNYTYDVSSFEYKTSIISNINRRTVSNIRRKENVKTGQQVIKSEQNKKVPNPLKNKALRLFRVMRMAGLEPARCHHRQILSLLRLPFRHIRMLYHYSIYVIVCQ